MTDPASWAHLPEPLLALLRTLRAKAAARARAKREELRREWLARWWREATTFPAPEAGRVRASKREQKERE
jgi:hypothetical protein